ncbi:metallophosphoesterase family protein [Fulvivirga sedimenti]|uniref:Phosphoesterase n=1 Tax=Fulvivirga sedimenti TaxID=2879465 RepID=A0A9X1HRW0_9BACT|nr:metallophosphoesterase family protein [Fulvivirga sedimenti]MCA6075379.1 metallophosphatase family protein [Fulvivirga sedimenti]MCA6076556.1 metallophosphatase family protein [Fulvivirga sedimenti]MCA6077684.1 metallophosphatase family protein [Fulvivirga sedimenti]
MKRIGLLSDTHGFLNPKIWEYFQECDEIWHAGDIGTIEAADDLEKFRPLRAVYGNIDGKDLRVRYPEDLFFTLGGVRVYMTHIGGYPPRYNPRVRKIIQQEKPDLFIDGHSHILKIMRDPGLPNLLHINPGAAGKQGFHKISTLVRFSLEAGRISDLQVIELGKRA